MPGAMTPFSTHSFDSEAAELVHAELQAIRETAAASGDPETLFLLDLLEAHEGEPAESLGIVLQISARLAADAGLAKREWIQQLLNRHAARTERTQTLWRTLVEMHTNGALPWAA